MRLPWRRSDPDAAFERRIGEHVGTLTAAVSASPVDDIFACVLMSCAGAGGGALSDFVAATRVAMDGDEGVEDALCDWLAGVDAAPDLSPILLAATWTYVARVIDLNWPEQYAETVDVAIAGLGEPVGHVSAIAWFGASRDEGDTGRFMRLSLEAIVQAGTGQLPAKGEVLVSTLVWSESVSENWELYRLLLDRCDPGGPVPFPR